MLKSITRILITLLALTLFGFLGILLYNHNRTYYNDENFAGNTSGNIYNGGLFCEQDGKIYFSNDNDDGSLYVMNNDTTNIRKVNIDKAAYINVDNNYIYYVRTNNTRENNQAGIFTFNNVGVYRINRSGANLKLISNRPANYLTLAGNHLYYQRYDVSNGIHFYRNKIDGSMEQLLLEEAVIPASVIDDKLYYTGFSHNLSINTLDLGSFTNRTVIDGKYAMPIIMGDYIYYISMSDKYTIHRMKLDGSEQAKLIKSRCSTFNITNDGKYLYYQVDNKKKSHIGRLNLDTMESEKLLKGNYKNIHVTEHYVFFKEFETNETYILSSDGTSKIGTFNPPNLGEVKN